MKNRKPRILIAMSGGVDSSVAAALLVQEGYDVAGMFAVNYDNKEQVESCWRPDYQDALRVAAKLKIPLLRLDFTKEYKKLVLDYMYQEYSVGRTPNPDVLCNKFIKFGVWLKAVKKLGFDKIATGHYAHVSQKSIKSKVHKVKLMRAKDENKDQTYFLNQLSQEQLQHVMFPLGDYTKPEVRKLALKFKLPTAKKEESMGICFIGEVPMKEFLKNKIKTKIGKIVLSDGTVVGEHEGLGFYTIGQRHIGQFPISNFQFPNKSKIQNSKPLFVVDKDIKHNILVVGYEDDPLLYKKKIIVYNVNWISDFTHRSLSEGGPLKCEVRLRHRQPLQKCVINKVGTGRDLSVQFDVPQRAVTPGQFAVFYKKGECLGGGVII